MTTNFFALGLGVGTQNSNGEWLDIFYPKPLLSPAPELAACIADIELGQSNNTPLSSQQRSQLHTALVACGNGEQAEIAQQFCNSDAPIIAVLLRTDEAPTTVPEAYLKLHLLSHRLVKPNGTDLTGLFGI